MKRLSLAVITISAVCLTFQSAQATLLFSEGFNYTAGALNPANTGNVWSGGNSEINVVSGNLTYSGLADQGGNMLEIGNGSSGSAYANFAGGNVSSGQVYYSFLFDATAADSGNNYFTALNPASGTPNGGSDVMDAYLYGAGTIDLRANAASAVSSGVTLSYGTTYLVVEEIDLTANTAAIWIDPNSSTFGGATAPTPSATLSGLTAGKSIGDVGFKDQSAAGGPYYVDNLYIGTTWADVTPAAVPEPSTFALAGLGILGLISSARRRMRR